MGVHGPRGGHSGIVARAQPQRSDGGGEEEVSKAHPLQAFPLLETILEKLLHQLGRAGQTYQTVAYVSNGGNVIVLTQHARAAAGIGDRNDGRQVAGVPLESAQQDGLSGTAADTYNLRISQNSAPKK